MRKEVILAFAVALTGCTSSKLLAPLVRVEELDHPPTIISRVSPDYTEVWSRSRVEAEAAVAITIQDDGSVSDVALARATKPEFGRAAVEAVKKWRFSPPTKRGAPVRVQLTVPIVEDDSIKFIMPNQMPEPTSGSVTPRAGARVAPPPPVAQLIR